MRPEYIKELLQENKTVIIPGIGAFVRTDTESQPVIFNEYLKFNDGLLAGYVSRKENISIEDAGKKLDVFGGGILSLLESGRDVVINGIGKLKMESGKMTFVYDASVKEIETPAEPVLSENKAPVPPLPKPEKPKTEEIKKEADVKVKTGDEIKKEKTDVKTPLTAEKKKKEKVKKEKQPRSKKRMVLFILLIILVGGGGSAAFIFREKLNEMYVSLIGKTSDTKTETAKTDSSAKINQDHTADTLSATTAITDSLPAEVVPEESINASAPEPVKTETKTPVVQQQLSGGDYFVIVGCFTNEENVSEMIEKANAKGLQGSDVGVFGGLHHVAVYSSSDRSDAHRKAGEIRSDFPNAWVLKK